MITKLQFAYNVRVLIESGANSALCLASQRVRHEHYPSYTAEAEEMETQFDDSVRHLTAQYGGDVNAMFRWPNDDYGKNQRLAVCDHIINELEQA